MTEDDGDENIAYTPSAREGRYVNYTRIGHNQHEFVLELGQREEETLMHTKLYISPAYTHDLLELLRQAVGEYEREYGPLTREERR